MKTDPPVTETIALVRRAQAGEHEALESLFARHYPRVERIVRWRMGRALLDHFDAEDIVQRTFLAAVRLFDRFEVRDDATFRDWLARIAQRQIHDARKYVRALARDPDFERSIDRLRSSIASGRLRLEPVDETPFPPELAARAEQAEILNAAIHALPDEYREIVCLRDGAGASWEQIAERLGKCSCDAARMQHARARVLLMKSVRRSSDVDE